MKDIRTEVREYIYQALRAQLEFNFGKKCKIQKIDDYIKFKVTGNSECPRLNFLNGKTVVIEVQPVTVKKVKKKVKK
jgi:hypothetical protein